jgi:light-regulated signal transduction histidine kinase (bacteriophytochrome)
MSNGLPTLAEEYSSALESYLSGAGEAVLLDAYEIGRRALSAGLGIVHIAAVHHESLATVLRRLATADEIARTVKNATTVEVESLSVFEMALRGYREANARLRELNEKLEDRARAVEAANKELEAFSYSVSHDLRAPLRAIDGFSSILLRDFAADLPPEAQKYLGLVRDNAKLMGQLIDDLLAFSHLGRQPLHKQPVPLSNLVRQVWEQLRPEQEGRRLEVKIGDLGICQADPNLLKQVFINLLANAIKFTRPCAVAMVEVGRRDGDAQAGERVYYVKDNGVGFDMQYADQLFGVFQRLHSAEEYEGTGVGLAIVQRIIQRHGGRIWAEAEVDQGATFFFTLEGGTLHGHHGKRG